MSATLSEPLSADNPDAMFHELAAPFPADEVQFKPQVVKGNRALAIAYIDARAVMDRLDTVVGVHNWQDRYQLLPDNAVQCRLRVRIHGEWVAKADVGSPSDQPDGGDRLKAAFSDALKRAAVKFGIGRYLYALPPSWTDYDPTKRQFTSMPRLPDWATPRPAPALNGSAKKLPADGSELHRRLLEADAELAGKGLCAAGALLGHVSQAGAGAGYGADMNQWSGPAIELAVAEARAFKARLADKPANASRTARTQS
jgi:Rad52/22 family double-strand break repair protein